MKTFIAIALSLVLLLTVSVLTPKDANAFGPDPLTAAVLALSDDIGEMADRIGEMADRIVEVNETSQNNAILMTQINNNMVNGNTFTGADGIQYKLIMVPVN